MHARRASAPTAADFGQAYFRGGEGSNYQDYARRQGRKIVWLPALWIFRRLCRQYAPEPITHLDLGCAFGYFLFHAQSAAIERSVGVDLSPYAVQRAKDLFPTLEFFLSPADALPFPEHAFTIITSFETLEHVPDVGAVLREVHRVLRPRGTLLLQVPYAGAARRLLGWRDRDPTHVSVLLHAGWVRALADGGFVIRWAVSYPTLRGDQAVFVAQKA